MRSSVRLAFVGACVALASIALLAPVASADAIPVITAGDYIQLGDGPGANGGGEFVVTKLTESGGTYTTTSTVWDSFCMEYSENFYYDQPLLVNGITNRAYKGGGGGGASGDPLDARTAFLYTQFWYDNLVGLNAAGTAAGTGGDADYDGTSTLHERNASYLQIAIWMIEEEISASNSLYDANNYYYGLANAAVGSGGSWGTGIGDVRVVNVLRADANGDFTLLAQDQLVIVPEPASIALLGIGLAAAACLRRKRLAIVRAD